MPLLDFWELEVDQRGRRRALIIRARRLKSARHVPSAGSPASTPATLSIAGPGSAALDAADRLGRLVRPASPSPGLYVAYQEVPHVAPYVEAALFSPGSTLVLDDHTGFGDHLSRPDIWSQKRGRVLCSPS
jgi:hypothetical protein